ncbi:MAG: hypothetical protein AB9880_03680 [Christensenellales bacterium]
MKKIIEGKVYDTTTATLKAEWSSPGSWRDFSHIEESLYLKKTGEFFLHGQGGPSTRYAHQVEQNSWTGGERLIPLSLEEAREWGEEHLDGDEYEAIFGAVAEDDTRVQAAFVLSKGTLERVRREAQERGLSMSALVEEKLG